MAKKREKTPEELVVEIMTKIKNVFKKDIFVKDNTLIFAGEYSNNDVSGDIICNLELDYRLAMDSVFGKHELLYIEDVTLFKQTLAPVIAIKKEGREPTKDEEVDLTTFVKFLDQESPSYEHVTRIEKRVNGVIKSITDESAWLSFAAKPVEFLETIFSENTCVEMKESDDIPYIVVGKKLFPLITLKNVSNLFYAFTKMPERDELNVFAMDFQFSHFSMYMVYYYLGLTN